MRKRRLILPVGALAALLLLAVGGFLIAFKRVEEERRSVPTGEARWDPFLACRRFLTEMGVPTETWRTLKALPPPGHLLMIVGGESLLSEIDAERLLAWVDSGGRLLAPFDHALMGDLGLDMPEAEVDAEAGGEIRLASRLGVEHRIQLSSPARVVPMAEGLETSFAASVPSEEGFVLVRFDRGQGWVAVFADLDLFSNPRIGEAEHASFLWSLGTVAGQPAGAALVYGVDRPSLGSLIWKHGWAAVVSLSLLVGVWVWSRWVRFGPVLPEPPRERRSLLEHIRATADYLWRQEEVGRLVASARQGLLKRAGARFPGFSQLPSRAKLERLASGSEVPLAEIGWALGSKIGGSRIGGSRIGGSKVETEGRAKAAEMLRRLQILERVRRSL